MSAELDAELKRIIFEVALSADQMVIVFEGDLKKRLIESIAPALTGTSEHIADTVELMNKAPYILAMSNRMRDEIPRWIIGTAIGYRWMIPLPE